MDLFDNNENEEEKKELPILKILVGIVIVAIIAVIVIVLILVLKPKNYQDYNVVINNTVENIWEGPSTNEVKYATAVEDDYDENNKEFYFGEYSPLRQFYLIMGPSYGTETYHKTQMDKSKDYVAGDDDKVKLAEINLVAKALDFNSKNGAYPQGIYPCDNNRLTWAVSKDRLNEYFKAYLNIQLSDEAFKTYVENNSKTGYTVKDENDLVFSISNITDYTYCPVIINKQKADKTVVVQIELVDLEKVDSEKIYKYSDSVYGDFLLVKKGDYKQDAVLEDLFVTYEEQDDGSMILKSCKF